jgi:acyl-CoA reductase-like NAD-dependent aldehyde dehydrogenase
MIKLRNFIDGNWVDSSSNQFVPNRNPANHYEILCESPQSTADDAALAIEAAHKAFPGWKEMPGPKRGRILFQAVKLLQERAEELATTLTKEEGKILKDSRGEVQRAMNILEFCAGEGRKLRGATIPSELSNTFIYTVREPIGAVGLITPWNFPVAIPIWKIAPALVSGNTVVFKPAELTPFCAVKLLEIFHEAGIPPGVLNLVLGSGSVVGNRIVNDPRIEAISFTGSNEVGCGIYEKGSQRGIRVQCEMGGKNPIVILADADLELAIEGVVQGGFGSTGQRCTAASRVIVEESIADEVIEALRKRAAKIRIGDGMNPDTEMGPLVDQNQLHRVLEYIEIGKQEGACLIHGGKQLEQSPFHHGFFVEPTLFDHVNSSMRIAQEEIFGPVISILRTKSFDEAIGLANAIPFGLSASIYTQDISRAMRFVDQAEVGKVHINSSTIGGEAQAPFGGTKATGIGPREQGLEVFEFYTEIKTVYLDYTGKKRSGSFY